MVVSSAIKEMNLCIKSLLKEAPYYENVYIAEDLTPLQARLLNYVEEECDCRFIKCHTINGNIRVMEA